MMDSEDGGTVQLWIQMLQCHMTWLCDGTVHAHQKGHDNAWLTFFHHCIWTDEQTVEFGDVFDIVFGSAVNGKL